jgi:DeoR/GlpR family transcriptional regulator of sugar metabolism
MNMLPGERQTRIHEILQDERAVRVPDLSRRLGVSEATIRRDLSDMEARGLLERTHGGSILIQHLENEPLYHEKDVRQVKEKEHIGRIAAQMTRPGDTVFANSGSTNRQVLRHLRRREGVRVVTSNAAAAAEMGGDGDLLVVGGRYRAESNSFVGPFTTQVIRQIYADIAFIGVDGVSFKGGLTTPHMEEVEIVRLMVDQTLGAVIVVADHTKFGVVAEFASGPLAMADAIVTDRRPPVDIERAMEEHGIRIIVDAEEAREDRLRPEAVRAPRSSRAS